MGEIVGMGQESSFEKRKELSIQEEKVKDDEKTVSIYDKNQRIFASNLKPLVDHKKSGSTLQSCETVKRQVLCKRHSPKRPGQH